MSYDVNYGGRIDIHPPIQWEHIDPNIKNLAANFDLDIMFVIDETHAETPDGTLVQRHVTALRAHDSAYDPRHIIPNINIVLGAFPERTYSGWIDCVGEDGAHWRIVVKDGKATNIRPAIVWPGDETLAAKLGAALGVHAKPYGTPVGHAIIDVIVEHCQDI